MELLSLKIVVLTLSGAIRLIFGLLPLALLKSLHLKPEKNGLVKKFISMLMFFGGGVLIATCFLHMMPHVRDSFAQAKLDTSLPVPEIIFIGGFFLVYMLEDVVHGFIHRRRKKKSAKKLATAKGVGAAGEDVEKNKRSHGHGLQNYGYNNNASSEHDISNSTTTIIPRIKSTDLTPQTGGGKNLAATHNNTPPGVIFHVGSVPAINVITTQTPNNGKTLMNNNINSGDVTSDFKYVDPDWWKDNSAVVNGNSQLNLLVNSNSTFTVRSNSLYDIPLCTPIGNSGSVNGRQRIQPIEYDAGSSTSSSSNNEEGAHQQHGNHHHHHHHDHDEHSHLPLPSADDADETIAGAIRNLLIVVAISFHGIFEGMAIGLQETEKDVWYLFLAVSLHECTILFCIGIELISSKTKILRMMIYILIVSLVCPIGMAIGIIVSEVTGAKDVGQVILIGSLQGLAAGTLLYVAFFEIFAAEGKKLKRKYIHIIVAIIGFVFMGALEMLGGHSHGGGGGDHGHSHGAPTNFNITRSVAALHDHSGHTHGDHAPNGLHSHEDHDHDHSHEH